MTDDIKNEAINALIDEVEAETGGMPMTIEREGKPDYTLVSTAVYNNLLDRLHTLEEAVKTDEQRQAQQDALIDKMQGNC